jgi:hypothetical protein
MTRKHLEHGATITAPRFAGSIDHRQFVMVSQEGG